jgi:hypothetical protein
MNTPVLNWWISVMNGEVENPPGSFLAGDVMSALETYPPHPICQPAHFALP